MAGCLRRELSGGMADNMDVDCETCREALSVRLDNEPHLVDDRLLDAHVATCEGCRLWLDEAGRLSRLIRVRPVSPTPDLTAVILARASQVQAPERFGWKESWRVLLALVGLAQLALGFSQLMGVGHGGHGDGAGHLFNESTAWNIGLGIGFAVAAAIPRLAGGLLPTLGVFFLVLTGVSVVDVFNGNVDASRLSSHILVAIGLGLLLIVNRGHERETGPRARRGLADESRYSPFDAMPERPATTRGARGGGLRPAGKHHAA